MGINGQPCTCYFAAVTSERVNFLDEDNGCHGGGRRRPQGKGK